MRKDFSQSTAQLDGFEPGTPRSRVQDTTSEPSIIPSIVCNGKYLFVFSFEKTNTILSILVNARKSMRLSTLTPIKKTPLVF